jgi:hypothetical protein
MYLRNVFRPIIALTLFATIAGCNDKEVANNNLGPALDPARAEILEIKLGAPRSQATAMIEEAAQKNGARTLGEKLIDVSGQPYVWIAGYFSFPGNTTGPTDAVAAILSPLSADNGVLALFRKLDFVVGRQPKPSSTQLLISLIEKYGMPTMSSPTMLTKEEYFHRVEAEDKSSEFFWIAETASKINDGCKYSINEIDEVRLRTRAEYEELFQHFYRSVSGVADYYHCGAVIRAVIRTSEVRDNAAELTISMVDFSAANSSYSNVRSLWMAKRDAEQKQRESEPKAPVPRL